MLVALIQKFGQEERKEEIMHSRIFQVSLNPINPHEYIEVYDYLEHWFAREIADYIDSSNRSDDIDWLSRDVKDRGCFVGKDEHGFYLEVYDKEKYFESAYKRFCKALQDVKDITLAEFTNGVSRHIFDLSDSHTDKFGFYVDADGELMPLDKFVRLCKAGLKYYIGGTLNYHF